MAKKEKSVVSGRCYITSSLNNTIVTITDSMGKPICWESGGSAGFKGPKKSTIYAAQLIAEKAGKKALVFGMKSVDVVMKGAGSGRDAALRGLNSVGIAVKSLMYYSGMPHNGCKPEKKPRS